MNHASGFPARVARTLGNGLRGNSGLASILLCTVVVGVLGLALHPRLLLLLPALWVVLLIGVAWPWLSVLLVRGRLKLRADRVHEGESLDGALTLRNLAPWPGWGLTLDAGEANRRIIETPAPLGSVSKNIGFRPEQRGVFPARSPRLSTGFPIGLVTASRSLGLTDSVVVWPRVLPVAQSLDWAVADMTAGPIETRRVGTDGDTVGVREYRRGDPMRWIHWSQTARQDRFMVREFQSSGVPRVRIELDCDPVVHVGTGTDSSFEWSVRIAASLAMHWLSEGAEVELLAGDVRLPAAGGAFHRRQFLDALAGVQLGSTEQAPRGANRTLATVTITTDAGWSQRHPTSGSAWRGFSLSSLGFGGVDRRTRLAHANIVTVDGPEHVAAVLMREKRGLAHVA